ncbi:hypothetical protein EDB81DRAFT_668295 [Dactylonectria macrodidyma]|uniref:C2H2-type domain-containing protein n=1 Tax=Dactylonectria macrodidyma TaxID=307937 RepID=A0A9P9DE81_9HYPO|nr:hypothetical protein EDB81DRAFT_668295 [Dactylonectria macrodidyma]
MPSRPYDCSRCGRIFISSSAKQQHIQDSQSHNVCHICSSPPDFATEDELDEHLEAEHNFCTICDKQFDAPGKLAQHSGDKHNMCVTCRQCFNTPSNLSNHKITHAEKNITCPGCSRQFSTDFAMVLHLEARTCTSGIGLEEITDLAFECRQSRHYASENPDFDFECPTCQTPFAYISGLLQHAESDCCDEELGENSPLGIFLRFVRSRIH